MDLSIFDFLIIFFSTFDFFSNFKTDTQIHTQKINFFFSKSKRFAKYSNSKLKTQNSNTQKIENFILKELFYC